MSTHLIVNNSFIYNHFWIIYQPNLICGSLISDTETFTFFSLWSIIYQIILERILYVTNGKLASCFKLFIFERKRRTKKSSGNGNFELIFLSDNFKLWILQHMRGTSQSAPEYSLSLKKTPTVNKIFDPPKPGPKKTVALIAFRIAWTLDV